MRDFQPAAGQVFVGIDIGGTKMAVIAYTAQERRLWKFPTGENTGVPQIRAYAEEALAALRSEGTVTAGMAVPGILSADGSIQDCDVLPYLRGWNALRDLPECASVLNDGEAALVAVAAGEPEGATVAAIGCGTGIAAAFQIGGMRLRQYRPYSGELGMAPYGPYGNFDEHASGAALVRKLDMEGELILAGLQAKDEACVRAVHAAGSAFGAALVTVLHILHPSKIGLYGGTLRFPGYLEAAMESMETRAHPLLRSSCRVEVEAEPELLVAHGALRAALSR